MKFEKTFGDTVKKLREDKNLSLREVALALNIDTSMLGKIEKNKRKPTKPLIGKFAEYFNVSATDLVIAFISDSIVHTIMDEEALSKEVFKIAEKKVKYLKKQKTS